MKRPVDFDVSIIEKIKRDICDKLTNEKRFLGVKTLQTRFDDKCNKFCNDKSPENLRAVKEVHHELCVAHEILTKGIVGNACEKLEYEPALSASKKKFDFRVTFASKKELFVEVKTIHPIPQDDWQKYEEHKKNERFPSNVEVVIEERCLGGQIYHDAYAARVKMAEYAVETETKIEENIEEIADKRVILVFCGDGFKWKVDELEDFIYFYRTGNHHGDDMFAHMEKHYFCKKDKKITRCISVFAYMQCRTEEILPNTFLWDVK